MKWPAIALTHRNAAEELHEAAELSDEELDGVAGGLSGVISVVGLTKKSRINAIQNKSYIYHIDHAGDAARRKREAAKTGFSF